MNMMKTHTEVKHDADKVNAHANKRPVVVLTHTCVLEEDEIAASPMVVDLHLNGRPVKTVLIDSGASRTLARRSALTRDKIEYQEERVDNMNMLSSSGHVTPITARAPITFTSNDGQHFSHSYLYIIDDSKTQDIVCDYVIGRNTLASADYYLDLSSEGKLIHKQDLNRTIACYNAELRRSEVTDTTHLQSHTPLTARQIKERARQLSFQKHDRAQRTKLASLSAVVSKLTYT